MACSSCGKKQTATQGQKISMPKPRTVKAPAKPIPAKHITIIRGR